MIVPRFHGLALGFATFCRPYGMTSGYCRDHNLVYDWVESQGHPEAWPQDLPTLAIHPTHWCKRPDEMLLISRTFWRKCFRT